MGGRSPFQIVLTVLGEWLNKNLGFTSVPEVSWLIMLLIITLLSKTARPILHVDGQHPTDSKRSKRVTESFQR